MFLIVVCLRSLLQIICCCKSTQKFPTDEKKKLRMLILDHPIIPSGHIVHTLQGDNVFQSSVNMAKNI